MKIRMVDLRIGAKIALIMAVMLAITVGVSINSFRNVGLIEGAEAWPVHTHEVLSEIDRMNAAMINRETGVRGYLISADPGSSTPTWPAGRASRRPERRREA